MESGRYYQNWAVVNEIDYMPYESTMRSQMSHDSELYSAYSGDTYGSDESEFSKMEVSDLDKLVAHKIDQINKETNDEIKKIRDKLNRIESRWDQGNLKKYAQGAISHPELSKIDLLLKDAMNEVAEIQRGANIAVRELSRSVESVENLYSETAGLKDSTDVFRKKAHKEKISQPMSFKAQVFMAAGALIAIKFLLTFFS